MCYSSFHRIAWQLGRLSDARLDFPGRAVVRDRAHALLLPTRVRARGRSVSLFQTLLFSVFHMTCAGVDLWSQKPPVVLAL